MLRKRKRPLVTLISDSNSKVGLIIVSGYSVKEIKECRQSGWFGIEDVHLLSFTHVEVEQPRSTQLALSSGQNVTWL